MCGGIGACSGKVLRRLYQRDEYDKGKALKDKWTGGLAGGAAIRGDRGKNRRAWASCGVSTCVCVCVCACVWKHANLLTGTVRCLQVA